MTLDELNALVGRKIGILASSETLTAEDDDVMDIAYTSLHAELVALGLARWGATESVPAAYADPVACLLAALVVDQFGVSEPKRSEIKSDTLGISPAGQAEKRLRRLVATDYIPSESRATYY